MFRRKATAARCPAFRNGAVLLQSSLLANHKSESIFHGVTSFENVFCSNKELLLFVHRCTTNFWCVTVGEEQTFLYPHGASGWSNNQIDMRQMSKRKQPHLICSYGWEPWVHKGIWDPTCKRVSEIERGTEGYKTFWARNEVLHLGA